VPPTNLSFINPAGARVVPRARKWRVSQRTSAAAVLRTAVFSTRWSPTSSPWSACSTWRTSRPSRGLPESRITSSPGRRRRTARSDRPRGARGTIRRPAGGDASSGTRSGVVDNPSSARSRPLSSPSSTARSSEHLGVTAAFGERKVGIRVAYVPDPRTQRRRPKRSRSRYTAAAVFRCTPAVSASCRTLGRRFARSTQGRSASSGANRSARPRSHRPTRRHRRRRTATRHVPFEDGSAPSIDSLPFDACPRLCKKASSRRQPARVRDGWPWDIVPPQMNAPDVSNSSDMDACAPRRASLAPRGPRP